MKRDDELDAQRDAAAYDLREVNSKPDVFLAEVIHSVACNESRLESPILCPEEAVATIDAAVE